MSNHEEFPMIIICIIVSLLSIIGTNLAFNQTWTSPVTCNCVNTGGLPNVDCIRKCYKPYVEHNVTILSICDIERCKANLTDYLFRSQFLNEWLKFHVFFKNGAHVTIRLSLQAVEQLSLHVGLDFNLSITLVESKSNLMSNCKNPWDQTGLFVKQTNSIKRSSIFEMSNREVLTKNNSRIQFKFQPDGDKGLLIQVSLAGNMTGEALYWPIELKTVYPPLKPSAPKNVAVKVRRYSDYFVEAVVKWECPNNWNAMPVSYKVKCLLADKSNKAMQRCELANFVSSCNEQCEFTCWQKLASTGRTMEQKILSWREQETSIEIRLNSLDGINNSVLLCRVQASNSNGNSPWSKIHMRTGLDSPSSSWSNMILELKTSPTTWSYVSYDPLKKSITNILMNSSGRQLFAQRHDKTNFLSTESNSGKDNILTIGCYDWLADQWYVFVQKLTDETIWLAIIEQVPMFTIEYLHEIMGSPGSIICDPRLSTLIWSETIDNHFVLKIGHLNSTAQQMKSIDTVMKPCDEFMNGGVLTADVLKTALFFTSSNGTSKTFWRMDYRSPEMKCTMLFNTNFGTNSSVISLAVFSSPYYPIYGNQVLVVLKYTVTEGCLRISTSIGIFTCPLSGSNHIRTLEYYDMSNKEQGKKIFMDLDGDTLEQLIPTNPGELEYWPQFASHTKAKFNGLVNRVSSFILVQPPVAAGCMYPNVSDVSLKMTSESTAEVSIHVIWDDSEACTSVSKPKLLFTVLYRLAEDSDQSQSCVGLQCSCFGDVSCVKRQKGPTSERILASIFLPNVKPSLQYYFEVTVTPDLLPYKNLWYNDDIEPLTYQHIISSEYVRPSASYTVVLLATFIPLTLSLIIIFVLIFYWKILKLYIELHLSSLRQISVCEIEKTDLLGSGNFCHVWKARINEYKKTSRVFRKPTQDVVAVKELKQNEQGFGASFRQEHEKRSFLEEAILLNRLKHNHIIKVLGISMDARPMMLVMEFMDSGSLDLYLQNNRDELSQDQLLHISVNCCSACKYLESNGIIHRDIKTKNCLVSVRSGSVTVKLADLGLAKVAKAGTYEASGLLIFPVQYTAPEGFNGLFTSKSDVWSFGVLLWELFAWGAEAFGPCLLETNHLCPIEPFKQDQVREFVVIQRKTLSDLAISCGSVISRKPCIQCIQDKCWKYDPEERPKFEAVQNELKSRQSCQKHEMLEIPTPATEISRASSGSNLDSISPVVLVSPDWYETNINSNDPNCLNMMTSETGTSRNINSCLDRVSPLAFAEPKHISELSNNNTEQQCQMPISANSVLSKCIDNRMELTVKTEQPSTIKVNQINTSKL